LANKFTWRKGAGENRCVHTTHSARRRKLSTPKAPKNVAKNSHLKTSLLKCRTSLKVEKLARKTAKKIPREIAKNVEKSVKKS